MGISIRRYRATGNIKNSIRKRIVSSKSFIPVLCIVSIIALACLHVWQRVYVIGLVAEVSEDRIENKKLTDMVKKSRVDIIELSRLSRIEKIAKEELGMNRDGFENIYTLKLDEDQAREHGLDEVVNSLKKLADNLPVLNESQAETIELFEQDE